MALVWDGAEQRLYVDGTEGASASIGGTLRFANSWIASQGGAGPFAGTIDEVRVSSAAQYTGTFTPSCNLGADTNTVAYWKCDEGTGTTAHDSSGNGNDGTLQGSPVPAWVSGVTCSSGSGMAVGRFGGSSMSSHSTTSAQTTLTNSPVNGSSMTITDTLGRIWGLMH